MTRLRDGKVQMPLKWHGGKFYLASKIVALMPRHLHYVEPFFGGGAVLLAREPEDESLWFGEHVGVSELVNDLNGRLINFWRVLRDEDKFAKFHRMIQAMPFSHEEWTAAHAHEYGNDPIADAVAFFTDCRQSRSGMMTTFTSITRNRTRRGMNGSASEWLGVIEGLPDLHKRLSRVVIENLPAIDLIQREDTPSTLFYCDPPYVHETRASTKVYAYEMTENDHIALLDVLKACKGKVMLSGYASPLYNKALTSWNRHDFDLPNHAAGGETKRRMIEVVWCNY